jgi:hypothetical protein
MLADHAASARPLERRAHEQRALDRRLNDYWFSTDLLIPHWVSTCASQIVIRNTYPRVILR